LDFWFIEKKELYLHNNGNTVEIGKLINVKNLTIKELEENSFFKNNF